MQPVDWAIVAAYFIFTAATSFYFTRRGSESLSEYFISGRQVSWWLAGASLAANKNAATNNRRVVMATRWLIPCIDTIFSADSAP